MKRSPSGSSTTRDTNVQYEALSALLSMNSAARWPHAVKALESDDYRVVFTGAALLRQMPDLGTAMHPLVAALERLTKDDKDTSRAPRLEIISRLKEIAPPDAGRRDPELLRRRSSRPI